MRSNNAKLLNNYASTDIIRTVDFYLRLPIYPLPFLLYLFKISIPVAINKRTATKSDPLIWSCMSDDVKQMILLVPFTV